MTRKYPEIAGERRTGERIGWGARQEMDLTHAAFRFHAERVIRAVVGRYDDHPAVIGFQVDNEPGLELLHNEGVFQGFVDDLRRTYGDVETLNRRVGTRLLVAPALDLGGPVAPDGNAQPQYDLAWRQFQAREITEFIGWQADIVREYARADQFVTTCIAYERPAVQDDALTRVSTSPPATPTTSCRTRSRSRSRRTLAPSWTTSGIWALFQTADRMYSSQPGAVPGHRDQRRVHRRAVGQPPAYDGQWRQAAWALVARGARMIEYWHWHTLHFGAETYWGGVLPHSQRPGRVYEQLAALGAEIKSAEDHLSGLVPDATVGLLWSNESMWGLEGQPALARDDGAADPGSYQRILHAFYRGAFDAGAPVRIVHDVQLVEQGDGTRLREPAEVAAELPVLLAPALYVATTRCSTGCATTLRQADTSCSDRALDMRTPRPERARRSSRRGSLAPPASVTRSSATWRHR